MFRQLKPDSQQFVEAYPGWVKQTAKLIASSAEGTTFGIFGPWVSGKTSASHALQYAVQREARGPLQPESSIAIVDFDCSGLRSNQPTGIPMEVRKELVRSGVVERNLELEKWIFALFRKASGIAKDAMPDPWSKVALGAVGALAESGQEIESKRQQVTPPQIPPGLESAFTFLDDLDRCDADVAWAILRNARRALPITKTVSVVVCDPVVLGHHVSHVLGVPIAHGFQAVLKYIDVPLKIPTASTSSHRLAIKERLEPTVSEDWQLEEVGCEAIESIPMRDILAALPQACLWLGSYDSKLRPVSLDQEHIRDGMQGISEVVFFIAILHICMPNAAQVIASGRREEFDSDLTSLARGHTGPMKDSTESAIQRKFGAMTQEIIAGRMDLVRYGRAHDIGSKLTNVYVGSDQRESVWRVLWDLVRS